MEPKVHAGLIVSFLKKNDNRERRDTIDRLCNFKGFALCLYK